MTLREFDDYKVAGATKEDLKSIFVKENITGFIIRIVIGFIVGIPVGGPLLVPFFIIGFSWLRKNVSFFFTLNLYNVVLLAMASFLLGFVLLPVQIVQSIMLWRKIKQVED